MNIEETKMEKTEIINRIKSELYIAEHFIKLFGIPRCNPISWHMPDVDIYDMLLNLRCNMSSLYEYEEVKRVTKQARISI